MGSLMMMHRTVPFFFLEFDPSLCFYVEVIYMDCIVYNNNGIKQTEIYITGLVNSIQKPIVSLVTIISTDSPMKQIPVMEYRFFENVIYLLVNLCCITERDLLTGLVI